MKRAFASDDIIPETQDVPPPTKKRRKTSNPQHKITGELTKNLATLYPPPVTGTSLEDPFEVDTQSDSDDVPYPGDYGDLPYSAPEPSDSDEISSESF